MRAFTQGGYADLRQVHAWNQDFVRDSPAGQRYERWAAEIDRALSFMQACGADPEEFRRVDFYAAHEALVLDYEEPLVRIDSRTGNPYRYRGTSCGWVNVLAAPKVRMSTSRPRSTTRSASSWAPQQTPMMRCDCSTGWTLNESQAGSASSPAWGPTRFETSCPTSCRRSRPVGEMSCGLRPDARQYPHIGFWAQD